MQYTHAMYRGYTHTMSTIGRSPHYNIALRLSL